ncbi:MAG: hypothetical protein MJ198_02520 [Bacteroidales bacterium]|nr:hypothetical protein [Bacteroidales bacterium]
MRVFRIIVMLFVCATVVCCKEKDEFYYTTVGTISEKIEVKDIVAVDNQSFLLLGADKDDKSVVYACVEKDNIWSFSKRYTDAEKYNDIAFSEGTVWLCGENMSLRKSKDTLRSSSIFTKFSYWDEWPSEKKNLLEVYVKNGHPFYMIGTDDLLSGSFYRYCYNDTVYSSSKKKYGLNDMVVCEDVAYVAGYGSVLKVSEKGTLESLEKIGGENFTHICSNNTYLFVSTYSGDIYRSEIGSDLWTKVASCGKKLLFVEANSFGDVIATGESKEILVSTDNGNNWREENFQDGNKISAVVTINDIFYIGTRKSCVLKVNHQALAIHGK